MESFPSSIPCASLSFFFFNDTATTEIYTLSLHDALPISKRQNLFQELDAVIHLLMEAKHWGLRKSRNAWLPRSEERFSRNAETDLVCRLLLEKKKKTPNTPTETNRVPVVSNYTVAVHTVT